MLALAHVRMTTAGHPATAQFDLWRQIVADAFTSVELRRADDRVGDGFRSTVHARRLGDLALSWLTSGAQSVDRTEDLVSSGPSGMYFLNLMLRGCGTAIQDGRVATALPGQFFVVDGDRPFTLDYRSSFEDLCLMVPKADLDTHLAAPELCTAVAVGSSTASGGLVLAALRALRSQRVDPTPRETAAICGHLVPLISLALSEVAVTATPSSRTALGQAVLDQIDRHYADPSLSPQEVARRVSISVSYLTKLLAARGTTFGQLLLQRRLEHAWAALAPSTTSPPNRVPNTMAAIPIAPMSTVPKPSGTPTITAVAHASGFRDSAHFARAFRARFGITPTQRRAGQQRPKDSV